MKITFSGTARFALLITLALGVGAHTLAAQRGASRGQAPPQPQPSPLADGEFTIRPPFANSPDLIFRNDVPHGAVHRFTMKSADSKIYKGISRDQPGVVVPYERPVAVYIPAQYVRGTPAPFIVVQDGYNPKYHLTVPVILDNLIADKRLPVMVAVLVQHGGGDGPGSQRGLEY